jgi:hypothetical protein
MELSSDVHTSGRGEAAAETGAAVSANSQLSVFYASEGYRRSPLDATTGELCGTARRGARA